MAGSQPVTNVSIRSDKTTGYYVMQMSFNYRSLKRNRGDGATAEAMLERIRARARGTSTTVLPHIAYVDQVTTPTTAR